MVSQVGNQKHHILLVLYDNKIISNVTSILTKITRTKIIIILFHVVQIEQNVMFLVSLCFGLGKCIIQQTLFDVFVHPDSLKSLKILQISNKC